MHRGRIKAFGFGMSDYNRIYEVPVIVFPDQALRSKSRIISGIWAVGGEIILVRLFHVVVSHASTTSTFSLP